MKKIIIILTAILLLSLSLRLYRLEKNPPSLYWDEVSLGWNAYSILLTGKDEHQDAFPISNFKAFGDYKPPVYIYLTAVVMRMFGTTDFAIRFPSAFFGILVSVLSYFIVFNLFAVVYPSLRKTKKIALLVSFLVTISPWLVNLSRVAFEANVAFSLFLTGLLLILLFLRFGKVWQVLLSAFVFALPLYTFNSSRMFIPAFLIFIGVLFKKRFWQNVQLIIIAVLFFISLLLPLIPHLLSPEGRLRFQEVNIFTNPASVVTANARIERDGNSWWSKIINNRRVFFTRDYLKHFSDNFDFNFLFLTGDVNATFSTRENGQLYYFDLLFLVAGGFFLFSISKKAPLLLIFLLGWLIIGIAPAGVARETPHALRTLNALPVYQIVSACGISFLMAEKYCRQLKSGAVLIIVIGCFVLYLRNYWIRYPVAQSEYFQYGNKEMVEEVQKRKNNYHKIFISNVRGRVYVYYLWYAKINPKDFWQKGEVIRDNFGFYNAMSFDNVFFGNPDFSEKKSLFVIPADNSVKPEQKIILRVSFLNGKTNYYLVEN